MSDYKKSYEKTKELLEKRISETDDISERMNWIETYKEVVLKEDWNEDLLDIKEHLFELLLKKEDIYNIDLPEEFLLEKKDHLDWGLVSSRQSLSRDFITNNSELIHFDRLNLSNYIKLTNEDIRKLSNNINWDYISIRDDLSMEFIREFKDNLNWSYICVNIEMSEDNMEEFSEYLDWKMVTICQIYSDEFYKKHELDQYVNEMKTKSDEILEEYEERMSDSYIVNKQMEERYNDMENYYSEQKDGNAK